MLKETAPKLPETSPAAPSYDGGSDADWGYTRRAEDIALIRQRLERERGVKERHTISRDSRIDGGVYEGAYGGEAIVVDTEKYPLITQAVEKVLAEVTVDGKIDKGLVLETVYNHVFQNMRYDSEAVDKIFAEDCKGIDGQKISLDTYISDGVGECRHQALFAGAILEKLQERGVVSGKASVERNLVRDGADGKYDGHSWVRYTNSAGTVYIMDIAQQKLDTLDNLMKQRRNKEKVWDYGRQDDHDKVRGTLMVEAAEIAQKAGVSTDLQQPVIIDKIPDWVMNPSGNEKANDLKAEESSSERLLRFVKGSLLETASLMESGTIDGFVLTHALRDESRKLLTIDRELSTAIDDLADEAKRQASSRYGFSPDLITRIRQLAAAI